MKLSVIRVNNFLVHPFPVHTNIHTRFLSRTHSHNSPTAERHAHVKVFEAFICSCQPTCCSTYENCPSVYRLCVRITNPHRLGALFVFGVNQEMFSTGEFINIHGGSTTLSTLLAWCPRMRMVYGGCVYATELDFHVWNA